MKSSPDWVAQFPKNLIAAPTVGNWKDWRIGVESDHDCQSAQESAAILDPAPYRPRSRLARAEGDETETGCWAASVAEERTDAPIGCQAAVSRARYWSAMVSFR